MEQNIPKMALALGAIFFAAAAAGQTIYESKEKSGVPVFSDQPAPGAKALDLPAPNISDAPMMKVQPLKEPAPPTYTVLQIITPPNSGTVHSNAGEFDVEARIEPPLDTARGDVIVVKLDGNRLDGVYRSPRMTISAEQFAAAGANVTEHRLEISVYNAAGKPRIVSDPVSFSVRRSIVDHGRRR